MDNIKNIFEHTDCISEEMLTKYVSGNLSPAEKHEVEKHLIDCEMCSDAVEGLQMMGSKNKISGITSELNQKIQIRVEKKKEFKIIFLRQYRTQLAVAASIIVVIGLVWFFRSNMREMDSASSEKIFADKFEPPPSEKQAEEKETAVAAKEQSGKEQIPADINNAAETSREPAAKVSLEEAGKKVVLRETKAEKGVSGGGKISLGENNLTQKTDHVQPDVPKEEKAENDNRYKNAEVITKGNATTISDVKYRDEDAVLLSKEGSKNKNELESLKEKDKKSRSSEDPSLGGDEAKKPESVPSMTATGASASNTQPIADKSSTLAKQENKKATDDRERIEEKSINRAQSPKGDVLALETEKKAKHSAFKKDKEAAPQKVSGGYFETQAITTAAPVQQSQTKTTATEVDGKILDSVSGFSEIALSSSMAGESTASDNAMVKYDKQDYAGAATDFEKTLKQDPNDEKALFYSAVSYLSLGQADHAITNLNKVLQNKNSKYYDDAQWYLSLAYIKKKDAQNARRNLVELQNNSKSKYQKKADETLKEMNK
jgi:tetratricopeptide (TPR) repeat protein